MLKRMTLNQAWDYSDEKKPMIGSAFEAIVYDAFELVEEERNLELYFYTIGQIIKIEESMGISSLESKKDSITEMMNFYDPKKVTLFYKEDIPKTSLDHVKLMHTKLRERVEEYIAEIDRLRESIMIELEV